MRVLIDNQLGLEIEVQWMDNEYGDAELVVPFAGAHAILEGWRALDPGRHDYRYGDDEDAARPSKIIVAWTDRQRLTMTDVDPFWSPATDTINAYRLDDIAEALPIDALKWGADIGEEVPAHG